MAGLPPKAPVAKPHHEIRVLAGPQRGARVPVTDPRPLTISSLWDGDIVLRNSQGLPLGFTLGLEDQGARLRVLRGRVRVGAREFAEGEEAVIGLCEPIRVGDAALALGPAGDARWESGETGHAQAAPIASARPSPVATHAWPRRLLWGGGLLSAVSATLAALALSLQPRPESTGSQRERGQALLDQGGWLSAQLRDNGWGGLALVGQFRSAAERQQAVAALAGAGLTVELAASIGRPLGERVQDVLRAQGVAAEVRLLDDARVQVTLSADPATSARAEAAVRADVAGLVELSWFNTPPRAPVPPTVDDPAKRVAAVVPGDPAYVVTADGARYFLGAMLPTGHVVRRIEGAEVWLEREGETTRLTF